MTKVNDQVTFRWKDYAHGNKKRRMTLDSRKLLRRFLLRVLPRGAVRIRSLGFLATRHRARLFPLCQPLLADYPTAHTPTFSRVLFCQKLDELVVQFT